MTLDSRNTTLLQDAANATLRSEPFDKTVCHAIIANGGAKKPSKKVQNVCYGGAIKHGSDCSCVCDVGHTVQFNELFAMRRNKKMGSQMNACAIYSIRFTRMNYL